jgi:hypothetical protein
MFKQLHNPRSLRRRVSRFVIIAMTIITFVSSTSANEEDLVKKLIGKWEGTVAIKNDPFRTLVIDSVKRDGDQWIATGRWGNTDKKGMKVDIKIQVNGGDLSLAFDAAAGNELNVKLVGDRELTGKFNHARGRQRVNADASLKKVD